MESEESLLKPTQRRTLQQALSKCVSCGNLLDYLEKLGEPDNDLRQRNDHVRSLIETALELDRQAKKG